MFGPILKNFFFIEAKKVFHYWFYILSILIIQLMKSQKMYQLYVRYDVISKGIKVKIDLYTLITSGDLLKKWTLKC